MQPPLGENNEPRQRQKGPEQPGPDRGAHERPQGETFRARRRREPHSQHQEGERGVGCHGYDIPTIEQRGAEQVTHGAHQTQHSHQQAQGSRQVPDGVAGPQDEEQVNPSDAHAGAGHGRHTVGNYAPKSLGGGKQYLFKAQVDPNEVLKEVKKPKDRGQNYHRLRQAPAPAFQGPACVQEQDGTQKQAGPGRALGHRYITI